MILPEPVFLWAILVFLVGASLGSFGNVIIARLPEGLSIIKPRSRCPHCKKPIKAYDNVPILSYVWLRGRCRVCRAKISFRYPLVEGLTAVFFTLLFFKYGLTVTFAEYALLGWGGIVVSFIDLDHRILPDVFTLSGIVLGLLGAWINPERHILDAVWGVVAGGGFLWAVAYIYLAIRKEEGMGGGDIKLLGWIGSVLGWRAVVFSILVSSITGSIVGGTYAAIRKSGMKTAIPFGPFLVLGAILFMFVGHQVMASYLSFFFPTLE